MKFVSIFFILFFSVTSFAENKFEKVFTCTLAAYLEDDKMEQDSTWSSFSIKFQVKTSKQVTKIPLSELTRKESPWPSYATEGHVEFRFDTLTDPYRVTLKLVAPKIKGFINASVMDSYKHRWTMSGGNYFERVQVEYGWGEETKPSGYLNLRTNCRIRNESYINNEFEANKINSEFGKTFEM